MKKKTIGIIIGCLLLLVVIIVGVLFLIYKNAATYRTDHEYIKSDEYFEESIENIDISSVSFNFIQVTEVPNINEAFYTVYGSFNEIVVKDSGNYDIFESYTNIDVSSNPAFSGMRYYISKDDNFCGAYFRYTFEYETSEENITDTSIEVYVTAEPLEEIESLSITFGNADEENIYSAYDNILYYMENDESMDLYQTDICTSVFDGANYWYFCGVIDSEKDYYLNKYCSVVYDFLKQL